jgi:hypothetical protein
MFAIMLKSVTTHVQVECRCTKLVKLHRGLKNMKTDCGGNNALLASSARDGFPDVCVIWALTIVAGTFSHGQGHATTFAQMVTQWLMRAKSADNTSSATGATCEPLRDGSTRAVSLAVLAGQ